MYKKVKNINAIACVLLAFQAMAWLSHLTKPDVEVREAAEQPGYYVGYNLFLIVAVVLFINARSVRRKIRKKELSDMLDSFGKPE